MLSLECFVVVVRKGLRREVEGGWVWWGKIKIKVSLAGLIAHRGE
jgi:hypothetical protein